MVLVLMATAELLQVAVLPFQAQGSQVVFFTPLSPEQEAM
jgi:hypothetical protein